MGALRVDRPRGRVDERDTMFARAARREGSASYADYYGRNPALRRADDHLRSLPGLLELGGRHYHPVISPESSRYLEAIPGIVPSESLVVAWRARLEGSSDPTETLREMLLSLGAVAAAATAVDPAWVYTHKGRFEEGYGRPVTLDHSHVMVFLVEMDHDAMRWAPEIEAIRESAIQYFRAGHISLAAEAALRAAGHAAKAHFDAHYDLILPPLAVLAGLGELGRNNILIADRHGSRVRIGAVSTDLPLRHGRPRSLGADRFCRLCRKCAENCPSRALCTGEKKDVRGVLKWPTHVERCYGYWRTVGTDCGICMAVCPFSHRTNAFHNAVRWLVRNAPWLDRLLLLGDDLVYGRTWRPQARE